MSPVVLARAPCEDLFELRAAVLGEGAASYDHHMPRDRADDTRHWVARLDLAVVGCVTVLRFRGWALRGMAVRRSLQRRGVGASLLARVTTDVAEPMWCNARLDAVAFYETQGWLVASPTFELSSGGLHRRMTWTPRVSAPRC